MQAFKASGLLVAVKATMLTKVFIAFTSLFFSFSAFGQSCSGIFANATKIESLDRESLIEFLNKKPYTKTEQDMHPWNNVRLTDPMQHNPNDFMYVIHGVKNGVPKELPVAPPTPFISASLISDGYIKAFGRFGYILDVKAENVIATWPTDGQTNRNDPWIYRSSQGVYSPRDLLDRSGWFWQNHGQLLRVDIYNEVLLDSGINSVRAKNQTKIIGFYIITDSATRAKTTSQGIDPVESGWDGKPLTEADLNAAELLAKKYNLPLVKIIRTQDPMVIDRRL